MLRLVILVCFLSAVCAYSAARRELVLKPFKQGNALKIISGMHNFDKENVLQIAQAAQRGGASHLDIAADPSLVQEVKRVCGDVLVCVSSIFPHQLQKCTHQGADMVEIGNFDGFYKDGRTFSAKEVLAMAQETRALLPETPLSVTIPHTLPVHEQVALAQQLEGIADILQTEGKHSALNPLTMGVGELLNKASPALAMTYTLSRASRLPILTSSGISDVSAPLALRMGASGVGAGSVLRGLDPHTMVCAVRLLAESMGRQTDTSEVVYGDEVDGGVLGVVSGAGVRDEYVRQLERVRRGEKVAV